MRYKLQFTTKAKSQIKANKEKHFQAKLLTLFDALCEDPYSGIGKPECLRYFDDNRWSRRIDKKNRLVYVVKEPDVIVISVIGHY